MKQEKNRKAYPLAVDLDGAVHAELPRLPRAAREQRPEDGNVQPPLHGRKGHLHKGRLLPAAALLVQHLGLGLADVALPPAAGLLAAVVLGHVARLHVDDGQQAAVEHALPGALLDVLAVVAAREPLGGPFLLEEGLHVGADGVEGRPVVGEVVEVVLVPCLADTLETEVLVTMSVRGIALVRT